VEVKPIPLSEISEGIGNVVQDILGYVQNVSDPLATFTVSAAGILILLGLICTALGITKRILSAGLLLLLGTSIMYMLTNQPVEIVGIVKGAIIEIFGGGGGNI